MNYFDTLSEEQNAAINAEMPTLIEAAPGTGKTRTLIGKVLQLIESGVSPHFITVFTFTNKAANEIRERVKQYIPDWRDLNIGTLHGTALQLLNQCIENPPTPLSEDMAKAITGTKPRAKLKADAMEDLHKMDMVLFDEVIALCDVLVALPTAIEDKFKYILLDECQDLTCKEFQLIDTLMEFTDGALFAVGDVRQAIYSFRGELHKFDKSKYNYFNLKECYRCGQRIVQGCRTMYDQPIESMNKWPGEITAWPMSDFWTTGTMERDIIMGEATVAVLARTNALCRKAYEAINHDSVQLVSKPPTMPPMLWFELILSLQPHNNRVALQLSKKKHGKIKTQEYFIEALKFNMPLATVVLEKTGKLLAPNCNLKIGKVVPAEFLHYMEDPDESIKDFVQRRSSDAVSDYIDPKYQIVVMTCHAAKGLEFDYVYLYGADDGSFCPFSGFDEEAKNLLYVTISRARYSCHLLYRDNCNRVQAIKSVIPGFDTGERHVRPDTKITGVDYAKGKDRTVYTDAKGNISENRESLYGAAPLGEDTSGVFKDLIEPETE